jgi:hypothetical protein
MIFRILLSVGEDLAGVLEKWSLQDKFAKTQPKLPYKFARKILFYRLRLNARKFRR